MSPQERRERGSRLCRALTKRIGEMVTPGLGRWEEAWLLVAPASDRFMDALHAWETSGAHEDREALEHASRDLVAVWQDADRRLLEVGRGGRVPA